mmetsp:Transcript_10878/g.36683  ORF Transcript_10878/g.36683 Transcript_10878/m.36683 type:complete len:169 (+) Transcript_10878:599-1105(+)
MWNVTGREATALSSFIPAKFRVHSLLHGSHVLCALYPLTDLQDAYAQLSRVNEGSPILFAEVNNKTSEEVDDIAIQSPSETCAQHHLPLPLQLSHDGLFASIPLWSSVVEACLQPHKSSPVLAERKRKVPALTRFLSLTFLPLALHVEATRSDLLLLRPRPRGSAGLL